MNKFIVFVDFDGTITTRDTNEAILVEFTDGERWKVIEEEWVRGNISSQEHFRQHFDLIETDLDSLVSYVHNESPIDPAFHDFVKYCGERRMELMILSDGFDVFIEAVLSREHLTHIPFTCNKLERSNGSWHFTFQQDSRGGDGRDWKQSVVDHYRNLGYRTVSIGDGLSDRGAITAADIAFVKKGSELDSWCNQQGIARPRFDSFKDLLVELQRYRKGTRMRESSFLRERFVNSFTEVQEIVFLAYKCSEFYGEKLRRANLQPEEIRSVADLSRLPLSTREEIQGKPWGLLTVPKSRICQIHASTSLSKGPRVYIPFSDDDLYRGGLRPFTRGASFSPPLPMLVSEKDLVINALPYEVSHLGLLFHRILQDGVGAGVVPVGKGGFYSAQEKTLQIMKDLKGDHLFTTPAYAIHLAEKASEVGYEIGKDLKPKSVWLAGESCSPGLRRRIEAMWKTDVLLCLTSLECGPIALECGEKNGMHVSTGYVFAEIIPADDPALKLPEGVGEIVATVLWRQSSPLIRYRTGLIGSIEDTACPCGLDSPRIRFWGRREEFLDVGGIRVSVLEIEDSVMELSGISHWYSVRSAGNTVTLFIPTGMSSEQRDDLKGKIEEKLRKQLRSSLSFEIQEHARVYKGEDWDRILSS